MSLGVLQVVLLAGALQGVCLAVLLFSRKQNQLANRLLSLLVLLLSFQAVLVANDNRDFFMALPHLSKVSWLLPSLFGPLIFLFTAKLTSEAPAWKKTDYLHLLPFLLILLYLLPYYMQSAEAKRAYLDNFDKASEDDFGILNQLLNFLHLGYTCASLYLVKKHEQNILQRFSDTSKVRLRWLKQFVQLAFSIILIGVIVFYARKWNLPWLGAVYHFHYLGVIIVIYWIGYKALSQPSIFAAGTTPLTAPRPLLASEEQSIKLEKENNPEPTEIQTEKYLRSGLGDETAEVYLEELLTYMQKQKPYLQNDLNIQQLADAVKMQKHHLSRVINERLGKNFYDFVNSYRVEEAKRLLLDPAYGHFTTLAIALEAGFSSKATFNAVFKKQTGLTPTAFVSEQKVLV